MLKGKIAIVTGGTRGIGRAIALELARQGCTVVFTYLTNRDLAEALQKQIEESGGRALPEPLDVADFSGAARLVKKVKETFGGIDILVNNAGIVKDKALYTMAEEEWDSVLDTNLKGVFNFTRAVITHFMKQRHGRVLNITSVSGLRGVVGQTNYAAAKAGIIGFTRSLAKEVARFNITVNALAPGFIETDMLSSLSEAQRQSVLETIPLGRLGQPQEVAHLALFLLSDQAAYITGQVFVIDGGLSI